jgi:lipopolysaccharide export LptBFGC system permease protein LptF
LYDQAFQKESLVTPKTCNSKEMQLFDHKEKKNKEVLRLKMEKKSSLPFVVVVFTVIYLILLSDVQLCLLPPISYIQALNFSKCE